jgi:hypothetical protein
LQLVLETFFKLKWHRQRNLRQTSGFVWESTIRLARGGAGAAAPTATVIQLGRRDLEDNPPEKRLLDSQGSAG